jgi:integrase
MSRRRGNGEGSIYRRESDGKWVAALDLGIVAGKRKRRVFYGRTAAEVRAKLRAAERAIDDGLPVPDQRTVVQEWLTWWVSDVLPSGSVRASTVENYEYVLRRYALPSLARVPLARLSPQHVHSMLQSMADQGLSPRTRQLTRAVLRRALRDAERWGLVARNAAALVEAPGKSSPVLDALSLEEARLLLAAADGDRFEALYVLALVCGLRRGEVLALTWDDVDLAQQTVRVRGTLQRRSQAGLVVEEPKTARSRRTVSLPSLAADSLRRHKRAQAELRLAAGPEWIDRRFVFTTAVGTPLDPRNVTRLFHSLCNRAGLGPRRFHALRHSAATLMLSEGVPLEVISETLGHAGYAITADVYAQVVPKLQKQAAAAMDRALAVVPDTEVL